MGFEFVLRRCLLMSAILLLVSLSGVRADGGDDYCNATMTNVTNYCKLEKVELFSDSNCSINATSVNVTLNVSGALNGTCSQIGSYYFSYNFSCENISISYFSDDQCTTVLSSSSFSAGANND